jgi:hypothetical protein
MCEHCQFPEPVGETRRSFLRKVAGAATAATLLGATRAAAQGDPPQVAKAGWARLITPNGNWNFHGDRDQGLAAFVRSHTDLHFDSTFHHVAPASIERLSSYPFLFSFDLTAIARSQDWANLREYLYRGGFIYLDNCVRVTLDPASFQRDNLERLTRLLPGAEIRRLSSQHPVFRSHFPTDLSELAKSSSHDIAYYGIYDDDRMVVLLSTAQLFCGWPEAPDLVETKMKLIANIYAYSLEH